MYKEKIMNNLIDKRFEKYGMLVLVFILTFASKIDAQVYVEKQSRHRFAQSTFGIDVFGNAGVKTNFLNADGQVQALDLGNMSTPRLIIGGTHFWGHADFAVIFPLSSASYDMEGQKVAFGSTIETSFKYFPWRIKHHRVAPYIGISLTGYFFQQENTNIEDGVGPDLAKGAFPLMAGFTFNHKQHLLEAGVSYLSRNEADYYLSEDFKSQITVSPTFFSLSYRYMLDTSLSAEKTWESGTTKKLTDKLASEGKLNNLFIGVGPSAAFALGDSNYNTEERPFLPEVINNTFMDFSLGYYLHNPDLNFSVNYRGYKGSNDAYKLKQSTQRQSIGFEITKMFGDYHGFVPYAGPIVSLEKLSLNETYGGETVHDISDNKVAMGLTFGWDIRPNRIQSFLLRTNLRWYPQLNLEVTEGKMISFNALEFNFIQLVYYPGRRKLYK